MNNPTTAFRRVLSQYGLNPDEILWDNLLHRFPGRDKKSPKNKSAWYVAFVDRRGGSFGDFSQGLDKVNWAANGDRAPTKHEREEWRRRDKARAKQRAKERARAAREVQAAWEAGVAADLLPLHPYLASKHIETGSDELRVLKRGTTGLQIKGQPYEVPEDILLVPMRKQQLVNVQRIFASDGNKRYWPGAEVAGAFCAVGEQFFKRNRTLYLCEGWATAWSISESANATCVAALSAGGLLPVAQAIKGKYRNVELIIAADNDRWTSLHDETPNPGVYYATQAAKEVDALLAIPDFKDLSSKPTDFNDLHRIEGVEVVKKWLNPKNADNAITIPRLEQAEPTTSDAIGEDSEAPPFRCLGVHQGIYYYIPTSIGQIVEIGAAGHANRMSLCQLAPLEWWEQKFSERRGVNWTAAGAAIMRKSHSLGVFQPGRLRGRGCWRDDDDRVLLHLGDRLLPPDSETFLKPEDYDREGKVYTRLPRLRGPSEERPMDAEEAERLVSMFKSRAWDDEAAGWLLAGWTALAPFCGALAWRPHVWLTGSSGCGKTTIIRRMVIPLLGDMALYTEGATTEAGIRQRLRADALPILYDEAERTTRQADQQMQGVLRLARSASSTGARIFKGTQGGKGMSFEIASMFLLSSVVVGLRQDADKTRVTVLGLTSPKQLDAGERRKDWNSFQDELTAYCTPSAGRRLLARTTRWFRSGRFDELQRVTKSAANDVLNDARAAEQYGTLAAGTWTMMTDDIPSVAKVTDWFMTLGIRSCVSEDESEGHKILSMLLQARELVPIDRGHRMVSVARLIDIVAEGEPAREDPAAMTLPTVASDTLKQLGIRVKSDSTEKALVVANQSEWIKSKLADTPYADGWVRVLRTIQGSKAGPPTRFSGKMALSRVTIIPFPSITLGQD